VDFCGIPEDDEWLDLVFGAFVPGKERLCSRSVVPSFRLCSAAGIGLPGVELFLDLDELLLEDRDEEERPFCADSSSGRTRKAISKAMAVRFSIVRSSLSFEIGLDYPYLYRGSKKRGSDGPTATGRSGSLGPMHNTDTLVHVRVTTNSYRILCDQPIFVELTELRKNQRRTKG